MGNRVVPPEAPTPWLLPGRPHKGCDPMCGECLDVMHSVDSLMRPIVRRGVDQLYDYLEQTILGYKRDSASEQEDLTDTIAECLIGGVYESIPIDGPEVQRRVVAMRASHRAQEARNG